VTSYFLACLAERSASAPNVGAVRCDETADCRSLFIDTYVEGYAEHCGMPLSYVDACLEATRLELAGGPRVSENPTDDHLGRALAIIEDTGYERRRAELTELTRRRVDARLNTPTKTRRRFFRRDKKPSTNSG
jgi:hypothetical protein